MTTNIVMLGLLPLYDYYVKYIKPVMDGYALDVDEEELIVGEVLLLVGAQHCVERYPLREFLAAHMVTEAKDYHLTRFHNIAYEILKGADVIQANYVKFKVERGYTISITGL